MSAAQAPPLKGGITTGSCAALAAKAAVQLLVKQQTCGEVEIPLPDGSRLRWPIETVCRTASGAAASVIKDAGDDPDVTHGARIRVAVEPYDGQELQFRAGDGVGTITLPGLALAVGEAAINPVPRRMIRAAIAEVTDQALTVTVAVDGGRELADKTFNPKLGIEGGISIIGTSGRVRPFSAPALQQSLKCALDITRATGTTAPVFVPGHMGRRAAEHYFTLARQQVVEVSNEWGFMLEHARQQPFHHLLLVGHPGKLAKLAQGHWQTHSSHSPSPVPLIVDLAEQLLQRPVGATTTVEGLFMDELSATERRRVAEPLAARIAAAIFDTFAPPWSPAVVLINLQGEILGHAGDLHPWQ